MSIYHCGTTLRRQAVLAQPGINGLDYVEVDPTDPTRLYVHLLAPAVLGVSDVHIEGGVRVTDIAVVDVTVADAVATVVLDKVGDHSRYRLRVGTASGNVLPAFDPVLSEVEVSLLVHCLVGADCRPLPASGEPSVEGPPIDYLARDYERVRRALLDRYRLLRGPGEPEPDPAGLTSMIVEVLADAADRLFYAQDAVASEAYLHTARHRISVRRHARLLGYTMHEGHNARGWVHVGLGAGAPSALTLPGPDDDWGEIRFTTQLPDASPGTALDATLGAAAIEAHGPRVFEPMDSVTLRPALSEIRLWTWSEHECRLPRGATRAWLDGTSIIEASQQGPTPMLAPGDALLLEQRVDPQTGLAADASPTARHIVRLTSVSLVEDPVEAVTVVAVTWSEDDALPFELVVAAVVDGEAVPDVAVARGNLVPVDHGATTSHADAVARHRGEDRYTLALPGPDLTHAGPSPDSLGPATAMAEVDVSGARPVVHLVDVHGTRWSAVEDLLDAAPSDPSFVVEVDDGGWPHARFGDGQRGRAPRDAVTGEPLGFEVHGRWGTGTEGNVGAGAIVHAVAEPGPSDAGLADALRDALPFIEAIGNPLALVGGSAPETIAAVRRDAPRAFRIQQRAVTAQDYAEVAARHPEVARAHARLVWCGSWRGVRVAIDRRGSSEVDQALLDEVELYLDGLRMTGVQVIVEPPRTVPLDIALNVHLLGHASRALVGHALGERFSARVLPSGTLGLFHPDRWSFGDPLYFSRLVDEAMAVAGVCRVDTVNARFQRYGQAADGELAAGMIVAAPNEILRLDDDPSTPEQGRFELHLEGGR